MRTFIVNHVELLARRFGVSRREIVTLSVIAMITLLALLVWYFVSDHSAADSSGFFLNWGTELGGALLSFFIFQVIFLRFRETEGKSHQGFDYKQYVADVAKSKKRLRILTTFLYLLSRSSDPKANLALKQKFLQSLTGFVKNNPDGKVRLLFLDPFSYVAYQREEERPEEQVQRHIKDNLIELYKFKQKLPAELQERIEVRVFDALPPFALLQVDNLASIVFFRRGQSITRSPRFEFFTETRLGEFIEQTFDTLWIDEKVTRLLERYMRLTFKVNSQEYTAHFVKEERRFLRHEWDATKRFYLLLDYKGDSDLIAQLNKESASVQVQWRDKPQRCTAKRLITPADEHYGAVRRLKEDKYADSIAPDVVYELILEQQSNDSVS
ncbi:MAG: hypothetical protein HXY40_14610 [Chloroflexi bacterium]|nr:hypothetical protein [Chloroflexota bacterium]